MPGEAMLRVGNVRDETAMESIRDALDRLGVDYEHVRSEPGDDRFPQTAYFYIPDDSAEEVEWRGLVRPHLELPGGLADEHLDTADGLRAGGLRLLEQPGLHGVVNRVEDQRVRLERRRLIAER